MPQYQFVLWDMPDDPEGNTQHIADHGLTPDEVESVLLDTDADMEFSRSTRLPVVRGTTHTGRFIIVVYEEIDDTTVRPVTAYEPDEE